MLSFLFLISVPTFNKDVKPIFHNRCSKCHDVMGDKDWQQYRNAYRYRNWIREKVIAKEMPQGEDMPQEERDLIVEWVKQGAKE